jgi:hypothetical protein
LGHLSEQNNHPEIARMVAQQTLDGCGLTTRLSIAAPHAPTEVYEF